MHPIELGKETDKAGNILTIYQSVKLGMSPAFSMFLQHFAETVNNGHAYPVTVWNDDTCGVIFAKQGDEIVGQITYDRENPNGHGTLWIILSSVKESHRRQGIYTILHRYLDDFAKKEGYAGVLSYVHTKNEVQIQALDRVGKKPIFYVVGKKF